MVFVLMNEFRSVTALRVRNLLLKASSNAATEEELMRLTGFRHKTIHKAVKQLRAGGAVTLDKGVVKLVSGKRETPKKRFDRAQTKNQS